MVSVLAGLAASVVSEAGSLVCVAGVLGDFVGLGVFVLAPVVVLLGMVVAGVEPGAGTAAMGIVIVLLGAAGECVDSVVSGNVEVGALDLIVGVNALTSVAVSLGCEFHHMLTSTIRAAATTTVIQRK